MLVNFPGAPPHSRATVIYIRARGRITSLAISRRSSTFVPQGVGSSLEAWAGFPSQPPSFPPSVAPNRAKSLTVSPSNDAQVALSQPCLVGCLGSTRGGSIVAHSQGHFGCLWRFGNTCSRIRHLALRFSLLLTYTQG